jgi:uncharacterized membrane protein (DUF485 family)
MRPHLEKCCAELKRTRHENNHISFIIALLTINFPIAVSLIATNTEFNKKNALKNNYGYFIGIGAIVTTAITVAALIFVAKAFF